MAMQFIDPEYGCPLCHSIKSHTPIGSVCTHRMESVSSDLRATTTALVYLIQMLDSLIPTLGSTLTTQDELF